MKKISILSLTLFSLLGAQNNANIVYCDKLNLSNDEIGSPQYKDCVQPTAKYTKDEVIAYKVPNDHCTPKKLKAKKDAIERLKKQDQWEKGNDLTEVEKLAYSVPNYETWTANEIKQYKKAVKLVRQQSRN